MVKCWLAVVLIKKLTFGTVSKLEYVLEDG
jgi:hypothetical protein